MRRCAFCESTSMQDRPTSIELCEALIHSVKTRILPAIPEQLGYEVAMIVSALHIIQREIRGRRQRDDVETELLRGYLRRDGNDDLLSLTKALSDQIRNRGAQEMDRREELQSLLETITAIKLEESNPTALSKIAADFRKSD
jgi:hypothetical protein